MPELVVKSETVLDDVELVAWFESELLTLVVVPVELTLSLEVLLTPLSVTRSLAVETESVSLTELLTVPDVDD